jgi:hypothetical protein
VAIDTGDDLQDFFIPISANQLGDNSRKGSSRLKIFFPVLNLFELVKKGVTVPKEFVYGLFNLDLALHGRWKLFKGDKFVFEIPFEDWFTCLDFP